MTLQPIFTIVEENEQLARDVACDVLECTQDNLRSKTLPSYGDGCAMRVSASDAVAASFRIQFEQDGVYLNVTPAIDGEAVDEAFIFYVIAARGIRGMDFNKVLSSIRAGEKSIRISDAQAPANLDECVMISISKNNMYAFAQKYPAEDGGNPISAEDVQKLAAQAGVAIALNPMAVDYLLQSPNYNVTYVIARGQKPRDGKPAVITYHFAKSHDNMPKLLENDKLDFRVLDLFENVEQNQALVTKTPAEKGENGFTVKGEALSAKDGRDYSLPRGKNVVASEDGLQLFAAISGRVDIINNKVVVSNLFETKDIDMSVGNVDFNGDILIRGNVFGGFSVKAAGNIEVYGNVEAATLEAGGHIVLHQGVQGMDKGTLRAGGDIVAKYVERASIYAHGTITAEALIHSNVESEQEINITTKRGIIIGGVIRANSMIVARTIGAVSHVPTILEVGASPALRARIAELESLNAKQNQELSQMMMLMQRRMGSNQNENRLLIERARSTIYALQQQLQENMEELESEKERFDSATQGRIHVLDTAFPGVKITIGNISYQVLTPLQYATFRMRNGEVGYTACDYA